ncbi:MAG: hypothetical protein KatS3mg057_0924 [Herpetosiphonaceae bacterium]|nr:MAG: hypothetical protein KatS3mg057_0924 [Herpetosiphonaceae bacterium]
MLAQKYSDRLGLLTPEQLQAAVDHFGLGRLLEAAPIPFGNWGQNVFVRTTEGAFALRGAPHYDWQFPTEQYFIRCLHEQSQVPVSWPYLINESSAIFGWSYAMSNISSVRQGTSPAPPWPSISMVSVTTRSAIFCASAPSRRGSSGTWCVGSSRTIRAPV